MIKETETIAGAKQQKIKIILAHFVQNELVTYYVYMAQPFAKVMFIFESVIETNTKQLNNTHNCCLFQTHVYWSIIGEKKLFMLFLTAEKHFSLWNVSCNIRKRICG